MNHRALLLLLIAGGLSLAALMLRNGDMLLLAVPFLAFLFTGLIQAPGEVKCKASRTTDKSTALTGELVTVSVRLVNQGGTLHNFFVRDALPAKARVVEGSPQHSLLLARGGAAGFGYAFEAPRGIIEWPDLTVTAADPLGLFEASASVPADGEVVIRPAPIRLPRLPFRPRGTLHTPGPVPVPLDGPGTDFLGIREYQPGDPLRRINWRLAARHQGRLFTNEHERHEVADYGLVVDARITDPEVFERAIQAAAGAAECILREGNRLAMLVFGKAMSATFPGYGKRQLNLVLRSLAAAMPSPRIPLVYLDYFPRRLFPRHSILLMISTVSPDDVQMYGELRAVGYEILLVSPDPLEVAARRLNGKPEARLAVRLARIERRLTLLTLSKLGVHVVDWQADQPLQAALEGLEGRAVHRRDVGVMPHAQQ